jgi:hypothetical protein
MQLLSEPFWLPEALVACPTEARAFADAKARLQAIGAATSQDEFIKLFEQMLAARDRLYEAWISKEMDA